MSCKREPNKRGENMLGSRQVNQWFLLIGLLIITLAITGVNDPVNAEEVRFTYKPLPGEEIDSLYLRGSFNGWGKDEMSEGADGNWSITLDLQPGRYQYKFFSQDFAWASDGWPGDMETAREGEPVDPDADDYADDGFGGQNAVMVVRGGEVDADVGDGKIDREGLRFEQDELRFFNLVPGGKLVVTFAATETDVEEVVFHYGEEDVTLERFATMDGKDFFRGKVSPPEDEFEYNFLVKDGEESVWYNPAGEVSGSEKDPGIFRPRDKKVFQTPDWVRDATFYQIFPDRFYNAVEDNDPEKIELYRKPGKRYDAFIPDWDQGVPEGSPPVLRDPSELTDRSNEVKPEGGYYVFYGGDLQGIEEKIPYLKELGINAIYFNPLFESNSNHRYSTADYRYIDGNLAYKDDPEKSNEYAFKLIEKLHDHGIRVIFDAVFNHSGYEHWAFQDVVENEEESEYKDWFFIDSFPIIPLAEQSESTEPNYGAWWGYGSLPELDTENPEVRQHLFEITEKWMDPDVGEGVDGWRLDVPNEIANRDPDFWREWREHVKSIDEDAYIVGEIWEDASSYLNGNQFDAVMNYRFRDAVMDFIASGEITSQEFAEEMTRLKLDYPSQSFNSLLNLVDSHDTKRFLTAAGGDKERLKLAALLQFTLPGAPMVYYGDERGMRGGEDPDCRRTMLWTDRGYKEPDKNLQGYYETLIDLRDERIALRRGDFTQLDFKPEMVYGFERKTDEEEILVILNAGKDPTKVVIPIESDHNEPFDLLNNRKLKANEESLELELDSLQGAIITF